MSNRARNVRYFPKMKVRGARKRRLAPWQRMFAALDQLNMAIVATTNQVQKFGEAYRGNV